ncbi:MAG: hypothetical protein JWO36_6479 [Myxococcales bacterium]|nr:hypothetical protein [Myxococcales bacterium]
MLKRTMVVVTSVIFGASVAHAQPGGEPPPPDGPPGPPAPTATPPAIVLVPGPPPVGAPPEVATTSNVDKGVVDDANSGRGWLMPTALTDPAGTWSFSDFELFLISGGYAVSDQLSISLTTLVPITNDVPFWGLASAKYQVLKVGNLRGAIQGAVTYWRDTSGSVNQSFTAADLGGALTLCIDDGCNSTISGFLAAGFADSNQTAVPFVVAGSFAARLGRHVKFVGELDSAFIAGKVNDTANGALAWYGLRFTSGMIGVDVGFMRPVGLGDTNGLVLGLPILSFTYRDI